MSQSAEPDVARLVRELYSWRSIWYSSEEIVDELVAIGPRAVPELTRALKTRPLEGWLTSFLPYSPAREVVRALARIGDPRAVDALSYALPRVSSNVALTIIHALGELKDPRAIPALRAMVEGYTDETWLHVASLAAQTLAQIPDNRDFRSLALALRYLPEADADYSGPSREALVARIVGMGDPAAITSLLSPHCASYVPARALARFGLAGAPHLLRALDSGALVRWEPLDPDKALEALILLGPEGVPTIRRYLPGASRAAASRCAIALCLMGAAEARLIEPVVRALEPMWSINFAVAALVKLVDCRDPSLRRALSPLRKVAGLPYLSVETRATCNGLIALIDRETVDLQTLPLPSGPTADSSRNLPIASRPME